MSPVSTLKPPDAVEYPEDDGKPMADNSKQFRWIQRLHGNTAALVRDRPDVVVAGNMLWYPRHKEPEVRQAPDVMVIFGRPKGDRSSYRQWEEDGVPVTVVFEVLSPSNTVQEMDDKLAFYEEYGVEEYYLYDPESNRLKVFLRKGDVLRRERKVDGFVSPRLGIRFDLSGPEMVVYHPDGSRFLTFEELVAERQREQQRTDKAEQRADKAEQRAARLAELSSKLLQGQLSAEERQELQGLLQPPPP
jgi:Uma2 family endonuclease